MINIFLYFVDKLKIYRLNADWLVKIVKMTKFPTIFADGSLNTTAPTTLL